MYPEVGQIINGKYRLVRLLGDGGMGSVFLAQHEKLKVQVALKFLHHELAGKGNIVDRFMQEARASAQIKSDHVVRVSDVDQTPDGSAFIVLEYLEGQTLQALYEDYHKSGKRLSYAEALSFAMQMVSGLEAAHEAGVVHRDLKPDNVMITKSARGEPVLKLLDFGIAKLKVAGDLEPGLTRPGVIMGTPEYMAPEQAYSADGVDGRADVFSLGVITFEMLAGRRPIGGEDPRQLAQAYLAGQTAKLEDFVPNVAPDLSAAVHKAMAPLAKDRFTTARAFREAIEPFAASAKPPSGRVHSDPAPPSTGSAPMMPPVALSAPGRGTIDDSPAAKAEGGGRGGVAKTWPPDVESGATKAMSPLLAESVTPGTVVGGDMTAMMSGGYAGSGDQAPAPAPRPVPRGKRKKGMSVPAMLGIACALGLVVAGFVVLATRNASSGDDDKPAHQAQPPPPAIVEPSQQPVQPQPGQQPPPQPQPPQPPPAVPPPPTPQHPQGPRPHPSGTPTAPTAPTAPPGVPNLPPGVPNIPGFPTAPTAPTAPNAPPTAPSGQPTAPPGPPGIPGLPPLPSGLPTLPGPFPPPPG